MKKKLRSVYAGLVFLTASGLTVQAAQAMSLDEAVKVALDSHPTIQAAEAALRASKESVSEAEGGWFPTIDLSGDTGYQYANTSTTRGRATRGASGDAGVSTWRKSGQLTLSQKLYDGFSTSSEVEAAEWRSKVSSFDLIDAREEIALRTIQSYLDVLRNRRVVGLAQKNVDLHNEILSDVETRLIGGQSDEADHNQARSRLALAKARLRQMQGDQIESEARFLEVVGSPADDLSMAKSKIDLVPAGLDEAIRIAQTNNPQLKAAKANISARDSDVKTSDASFQPTFDLDLYENRDWDVSGIEGPSTDRRAVVSFNYNLYRGGSDKARKRRALELASEARLLEAETYRAIERQARIAYSAFETASERLAYLQARAAASGDAVKSFRSQYDIGQRSLLDVLDVENELFQSHIAFADGELEFQFTQFQVLASMGELVNSFSK